jgi:hypothetical protein
MSNSRLLLAIVTLCSACGGSSFGAGGTGGSSGSAADAGSTSSNAGATSSAGASSGGSAGDSSAGASAGGGQATGGTATAGAGGSSAGGSSAGGSGAGAGGAGAGGSSGGATAGAGGSAGANCATLKTDYAAALEKARVCDKGLTNQCSTSSTLPTMGCGCPVLVNSKSEATTLAKAKYQAFQDAKCPVGPICNIACLAYTGATCSAQTMGTGNTFVCTGSSGVAAQ